MNSILSVKKRIFSIDVESEGLYGDPFAVGVSVISMEKGEELDSFLAVSPLSLWFQNSDSFEKTYEFLSKNVLPTLPFPDCNGSKELCNKFWNFYTKYNNEATLFVADCGAPVEANFFRHCIHHDSTRTYMAPYPLHELATLLLVKGKDPIGTYERKENEKLVHNPLHDARQSGRLFWENLKEM